MRTILGMTLALLCVGASAQGRLGRLTGETFQQLGENTVSIGGGVIAASAFGWPDGSDSADGAA